MLVLAEGLKLLLRSVIPTLPSLPIVILPVDRPAELATSAVFISL